MHRVQAQTFTVFLFILALSSCVTVNNNDGSAEVRELNSSTPAAISASPTATQASSTSTTLTSSTSPTATATTTTTNTPATATPEVLGTSSVGTYYITDTGGEGILPRVSCEQSGERSFAAAVPEGEKIKVILSGINRCTGWMQVTAISISETPFWVKIRYLAVSRPEMRSRTFIDQDYASLSTPVDYYVAVVTGKGTSTSGGKSILGARTYCSYDSPDLSWGEFKNTRVEVIGVGIADCDGWLVVENSFNGKAWFPNTHMEVLEFVDQDYASLSTPVDYYVAVVTGKGTSTSTSGEQILTARSYCSYDSPDLNWGKAKNDRVEVIGVGIADCDGWLVVENSFNGKAWFPNTHMEVLEFIDQDYASLSAPVDYYVAVVTGVGTGLSKDGVPSLWGRAYCSYDSPSLYWGMGKNTRVEVIGVGVSDCDGWLVVESVFSGKAWFPNTHMEVLEFIDQDYASLSAPVDYYVAVVTGVGTGLSKDGVPSLWGRAYCSYDSPSLYWGMGKNTRVEVIGVGVSDCDGWLVVESVFSGKAWFPNTHMEVLEFVDSN